MFSLQLSLVSVADNSHFCLFHINPYAKHKIQPTTKYCKGLLRTTKDCKVLLQYNSTTKYNKELQSTAKCYPALIRLIVATHETSTTLRRGTSAMQYTMELRHPCLTVPTHEMSFTLREQQGLLSNITK